jgi:hypothetical protein
MILPYISFDHILQHRGQIDLSAPFNGNRFLRKYYPENIHGVV